MRNVNKNNASQPYGMCPTRVSEKENLYGHLFPKAPVGSLDVQPLRHGGHQFLKLAHAQAHLLQFGANSFQIATFVFFPYRLAVDKSRNLVACDNSRLVMSVAGSVRLGAESNALLSYLVQNVKMCDAWGALYCLRRMQGAGSTGNAFSQYSQVMPIANFLRCVSRRHSHRRVNTL